MTKSIPNKYPKNSVTKNTFLKKKELYCKKIKMIFTVIIGIETD